MKKIALMMSSILASALLVGGTFAAYAVTDGADPIGINVTPGNVDVDDTKYITLNWGEGTYLNNVEEIKPGDVAKIGTISLQSTLNYEGVLTVELEDETSSRPEGNKKLIDYLKIYLYNGANTSVPDNELPYGDPLASNTLGQYDFAYNHAAGSNAGKEYSIYVEYDASGSTYSGQIANDIITIRIDWSAQSGDEVEGSRDIYFASSWNDCYLYAWSGNGANGIYPGVKLTKVGLNEYNQFIYKGILLDTYEKIIFSNGGTAFGDKTQDLIIADTIGTTGEYLLWRNDDGSAGSTIFQDSMVKGYAGNMGNNPGPILQAWDWRLSDVESRLDDIEQAGYKAVQVSPMQPLSWGGANQGWYMLYQPIGFTISTNNKNPLGNKSDLESLTAAAAEHGIEIIVDVVANHLAAGEDYKLHPDIATTEPEIYNNWLIHEGYGETNDSSVESVVRANLGKLPDLKTEDGRVQARVISLLKEYIDAGVSGFRFDAAKHIETPNDWNCASNFWPNVIGEVNKYALENDKDAPYCYGEVLGTGASRPWSGYTDYIDVTDYGITWQTRDAFSGHNASGVQSGCNYTVGGADKALVYAESHDNFCHGDTTEWGSGFIDMIYCLQAVRAEASSLFYARPCDDEKNIHYDNDKEKNVADPNAVVYTPEDDYKNAYVSAAHRIYNDFVGGAEYISQSNNCVAVARTNTAGKCGVFICNPAYEYEGSAQKTVTVYVEGGVIPNGSYLDLLSGGHVSVNNGQFTITLSSAMAFIELE